MKKLWLILFFLGCFFTGISQQKIIIRGAGAIDTTGRFVYNVFLSNDSLFYQKGGDNVYIGKITAMDSLNVLRDSLQVVRDSLAAYRAEDTVYTTSGIETVYGGDSTTIRLPYKSYVALLSQSGTDAPTAIVLQNDLGGTVVWSRSSTGNYIATLVGAFTENKSWCVVNDTNDAADVGYFSLIKVDTDSFILSTSDSSVTPVDDLLINTSIEIRVYY